MPHLVMCGRYWRIGGDELPLPASFAIFGRIVWVVILIIIASKISYESTRCHEGIDAYLYLSAVIFFLSIIVEILIAWSGTLGNMIEVEVRAGRLQKFLMGHYALVSLQLIVILWGIAILSNTYNMPCTSGIITQNNTDVILLTLVVISQSIDAGLMLFCAWFLSSKEANGENSRGGSLFDPNIETGSASSDTGAPLNSGAYRSDSIDDYDDYETSSQRVWASRCHFLCRMTQGVTCGLFGTAGTMQDIEAVAKVLTNFFHHDGFLDVVPSDAAAGILLVRLLQRSLASQFGDETDAMKTSMIDTRPSGPSGGNAMSAQPVDNIPAGIYADHDRDGKQRYDLPFGGVSKEARLVQDPSPLYQQLPQRTRMTLGAARHNLDKLNPRHRELCADLFRGSQYAFAIYTHLLYLYAKPVTGLCKMCHACHAHNACEDTEPLMRTAPQQGTADIEMGHPPRVDTVKVGDNCCAMNQAAVKAVLADMDDAEVVFSSYENTTERKPYSIFLDHKKQQVVVAVRGTLSLEDCLTDAICDADELTLAGDRWGFDGHGMWAHSGFLRTAMRMREEIDRKGVLASTLGPGVFTHDARAAGAARGGAIYEHYSLLVVGHSLGAGVAFLLALLLRPQYPTLRCYGYGTPGSLADEKLSKASAAWMTSVVLDDDLISRLGVGSLNHLRDQVLDCIVRARVNKTQIMQTLFRTMDVGEFLYEPEAVPPSKFKESVDAFRRMMKQRNATELDASDGGTIGENLTIPGAIIHLVRPGGSSDIALSSRNGSGATSAQAGGCCSPRKPYFPREVAHEAFAELIISGNMAIDHFPDRYVDELGFLVAAWQPVSDHTLEVS